MPHSKTFCLFFYFFTVHPICFLNPGTQMIAKKLKFGLLLKTQYLFLVQLGQNCTRNICFKKHRWKQTVDEKISRHHKEIVSFKKRFVKNLQ